LFAYGPVDATASPNLLPHLNHTGCPGKEAVGSSVVGVVVVAVVPLQRNIIF